MEFWCGVFKNNYMVIRGELKYIQFCPGEVLTPVCSFFQRVPAVIVRQYVHMNRAPGHEEFLSSKYYCW